MSTYQNILFFNKSGNQHNFSWNGTFWEGRILLPQVSVDLFEVEHIFAVEKLRDINSNYTYGLPHSDTPGVYGNPMGIIGTFVISTNTVTLSGDLSSDLIGSYIFSAYFTGTILGINDNIATLSGNATSSGTGPISFAAWRTRFETNYNIVDFDEVPSIIASFTAGNTYLTSFSDLSLLTPGYNITGEGIPAETKIISIVGTTINVNKSFLVTAANQNCYVYQIEDANDVSSRLYQYNLINDPTLDAPVILNLSEINFPTSWAVGDIVLDGVRKSSAINSSSIGINIALNSDQGALIGRSLIIEDITQALPVTILRVELVGEVIEEDERLNVLLGNIGQQFNKEDAGILRDSDPEEPYPDYIILNRKRKELLLQASEIFPYLGSYKGLVNIITFFGYQDLTIKEYWLNITKSSSSNLTAFQQNSKFLDNLQATPYNQSTLINNLLDDENSGKYKQVIVYGPNDDGTFSIQSSLEQIFPSTSYKKTPLFGLFYDINEIIPNQEDEWGYPVTQNSFLFSPQEVLIKLFALKQKLLTTYLPVTAKIIDITGEGFYFSINKPRGWIDTLKIDEISLGLDITISASPQSGYVEDLRAFQTRSNSSLPQLPFVPGYEGNTDSSDFGNTVDLNPYSQSYTPEEASSIADAIIAYHTDLINNNGKFDLGDGDYNGPGYIRYQDNTPYYLPGGFPTVLEVSCFNITMDDVSTTWDNLDTNISTYDTTLSSSADLPAYTGIPLITSNLSFPIQVDSDFLTPLTVTLPVGLTGLLNPLGGKVQLQFMADSNDYFVGEVQSYNNVTGITNLLFLYYVGSGEFTEWNVSITNIFSQRIAMTYYNYTQGSDGLYSWDNLRFVGYYEIEWTISKVGDNPYNYQFRGNLKDYWRIPQILPYIGNYTVKCKIWNSFNDTSTGYFIDYITVEPRNIELTSIARFRQAEIYTWDQMIETWDDYDCQWQFPIEQQNPQPQTSQINLTYSEYGNHYYDGQECNVLTPIPEIKANLNFNLGVVSHQIISISSLYGVGFGPATVTTADAHGISPGDSVFIKDNSTNSITGEYSVLSVTATTFIIPLIIYNTITTVGNYVTGGGSLNISISERSYINVDYDGSIGSTAGTLYSLMNGGTLDPQFTIMNYTPTTVAGISSNVFLYNIIMESPDNTGSAYNGQVINITTTGSLVLNIGDTVLTNSITPALAGGANQTENYIYYSPGDPLPISEMKNWGSKEINWDSFTDISWDQLYSQTWSMYDFHGDWNGGFDLYNIRYGDTIKVGKNNPGVLIGTSTSPGYPMFLYDVANQLNQSQDPGISKFNYQVRGYSRVYGSYDSLGNNLIEDIIAPHITYTQSSVYSGYVAADYTSMTNGSYRELNQTVTSNSSNEWIQLDLNQPMPITSVVIGCDFSSSMTGSWGPTFTQNKSVSYSLDGINWILLFNTGTFTQGIEEFIVNVTARYIKISSPGAHLVVTEFYAMIPFSTGLGPMDEITTTYGSLGFNPTSICRGLYGEIYMADGNNIHVFKSPTNIDLITLSYPGTYLQIDRKGNLWYYGQGAVPLQIIDTNNINNITAFVSETGSITTNSNNIIIPYHFTTANITALAIDDRNRDFAISITFDHATNWLLYYDGDSQEFEIHNTSDGLLSTDIRQMIFDYKDGNKILWIATGNGISLYDRIKFFNYQTNNSGLLSNNVYSICIDEINNKWIGTDSGITYYDGDIWAVWNPGNSAGLLSGEVYSNIITVGHGNIFFTISNGTNYFLGYFNGDDFIRYTNEPGNSVTFAPYLNPGSPASLHRENTWILVNKVKTIDGAYTQYPGNIFYLSSTQALKQIDYVIPHIQATSNFPGNDGWDFIYYNSSRSLPSIELSSPSGIAYGLINFNFLVGPVNGNYILADNFRPNFPFVDGYSWKVPDWAGFDFSQITKNHPELNPDHLFLDAPLRDILNGSAIKEEYWRNSPIERSADKKARDQFSDFEWLISIGDNYQDRGIKIVVGDDGYIYVTGYFQGTIYFGSPNNINSGSTTTINSPNCISVFVAKYNSVGIIQWVRMYGEPNPPYGEDFIPSSIKLDRLGNVYVVGYKQKNGNNLSSEQPSNFLIRWDWNGTFIGFTELFTPSASTTYNENIDIVVDDANNLYIAGEFNGTLTSGVWSITSSYGPSLNEIYIANVDSNGNVIYLRKIESGKPEYSPSLALGNYNDLYIAYYNKDINGQNILLSSYNSLTFTSNWTNIISNTDFIRTSLSPIIKLSTNGELVLGVSFNGTLTLNKTSISCPDSLEYGIFKFLTTGNFIFAKNVGSSLGDCLHDIDIDSEGRIYMLGSYTGSFSPDNNYQPFHENSVGASDVLLIKLEIDGTIIDITTIGSISADEGLSISLDTEENIYLTGYLSGSIITGDLLISPNPTGNNNLFVGKIPHQSYIPGKSFAGPVSWLGTQSWGYSDKRIYKGEFEIPIGTPVFINPLDSNIPGKKNHEWQLIEQSTGNVIVDVKDVPYFIWTFTVPGYFDLVITIEDTNGNIYTTTKNAYIRVVDHSAIFNGETVPHIINSNDFRDQAIYPY